MRPGRHRRSRPISSPNRVRRATRKPFSIRYGPNGSMPCWASPSPRSNTVWPRPPTRHSRLSRWAERWPPPSRPARRGPPPGTRRRSSRFWILLRGKRPPAPETYAPDLPPLGSQHQVGGELVEATNTDQAHRDGDLLPQDLEKTADAVTAADRERPQVGATDHYAAGPKRQRLQHVGPPSHPTVQ